MWISFRGDISQPTDKCSGRMGFRQGLIQWLIDVTDNPAFSISLLCCPYNCLHPKASKGFFIYIQHGRRESSLSQHSLSKSWDVLDLLGSHCYLWADHSGQGMVCANRPSLSNVLYLWNQVIFSGTPWISKWNLMAAAKEE